MDISVNRRSCSVASHVIQYQDPFFRLLAADPEIDVTVFYCSRAGAEVYRDADMQTSLRWDIELLQGYRHVFLRNFGCGDGYTRLINPGVMPAIARGNFDAVLFFLGWGTITSLLGIAACRVTDTPFFLYGDSSFPPPEDTWRARMRAAFIRGVFALASGFMVSGVLNADVLPALRRRSAALLSPAVGDRQRALREREPLRAGRAGGDARALRHRAASRSRSSSPRSWSRARTR